MAADCSRLPEPPSDRNQQTRRRIHAVPVLFDTPQSPHPLKPTDQRSAGESPRLAHRRLGDRAPALDPKRSASRWFVSRSLPEAKERWLQEGERECGEDLDPVQAAVGGLSHRLHPGNGGTGTRFPAQADGKSRRKTAVAGRRLAGADWVGKRALPLGSQSA
jgi:hypothetical protein